MIRMRGEIRSKNDDGSFIYDVTNFSYPFHQDDLFLNNLSADFFDVLETKGSISSEFLFKAHSFSEAKTYQNKKANAVVTRHISSNQKTENGYAVQSVNYIKSIIYIRGAKIRSFTIEFDHNNSVFPTQMTVREYRSQNELPAFRPDETLRDYNAIGNAYTVTNDSYSYKFVSANLPDMISIQFDYLNKPNYPVVITRIAANEIYYLDKRNLISSSLSFGYGQDVNEPEMEIANYEDTIVALDDTGDLQRMEAEGALIGADVVLWLEDTITHRIEYYYHRVIDSIQYNNDTKQATLKISSGIKSLQSVYRDPVYGFSSGVSNEDAWVNILMDYNYLDVSISPKNAVFYIQDRRLFNITTVYKGIHGDEADTKSFWVLITELCECAGATFAIDQNGVYTFYASNSDSV